MNTRWFTHEVVRGEPIQVGMKTITPLVRRIVVRFDWLGAQATTGAHVEQVQPIGVIEKIDEVERRVPIEDVTGAALRFILISGVVVSALTWFARRLFARRSNKT